MACIRYECCVTVHAMRKMRSDVEADFLLLLWIELLDVCLHAD